MAGNADNVDVVQIKDPGAVTDNAFTPETDILQMLFSSVDNGALKTMEPQVLVNEVLNKAQYNNAAGVQSAGSVDTATDFALIFIPGTGLRVVLLDDLGLGGGGGYVAPYTNNGAIIFASGAGVTFTKTPADGEYDFQVPSGVILYKAFVPGLNSDTDAGGELFVKVTMVSPGTLLQDRDSNAPITINVYDRSAGTIDRTNGRQYFDNHIYELTDVTANSVEVKFNNMDTIVPLPMFCFRFF